MKHWTSPACTSDHCHVVGFHVDQQGRVKDGKAVLPGPSTDLMREKEGAEAQVECSSSATAISNRARFLQGQQRESARPSFQRAGRAQSSRFSTLLRKVKRSSGST